MSPLFFATFFFFDLDHDFYYLEKNLKFPVELSELRIFNVDLFITNIILLTIVFIVMQCIGLIAVLINSTINKRKLFMAKRE